MKRNFFIVVLFLFIFLTYFFIKQAVYAKKNNNEKWAKVNEYIYIDKSSIEKFNDSTSAWLKFYNSPNHKLSYEDIDGIKVHYEIVKYEAYCKNDNALFIRHLKFYDKYSNLLYEEADNHNVGASCSAYIDGEIICRAICKN